MKLTYQSNLTKNGFPFSARLIFILNNKFK